MELSPANVTTTTTIPTQQTDTPIEGDPFFPSPRLVICGQDVSLDILARHLDRHPNGARAFRHHVGSFTGLLALYQGKAHLASAHLWDGDNDVYNLTYVRYMLCGTPAVIVHLACRMQGFYVAKGNPKGIKTWQDLMRPDVVFINREKGCGTRVLLDEQIRLMKMDRRQIRGYERKRIPTWRWQVLYRGEKSMWRWAMRRPLCRCAGLILCLCKRSVMNWLY
jgi:putative molybdopterin biosynthesis protein